MKIILYLLSGVLTAPGAALAYFFWCVSDAVRQKNIFTFIFFVFGRFCDTIMWSIWFLVPGVAFWLTLAFLSKYRWIGASGMAVIAAVSLVEMFVGPSDPPDVNQLFFPVLSLSGLFLNIWIVYSDLTSSSGQ